jgi:hypothetical protein
VFHWPRLLAWVPRIHTSAARGSFQRGTSGRRLSTVEFAVTASRHQLLPPSRVVPRNSSRCRHRSAALTSAVPVAGSASVKMVTTLGSLGSSAAAEPPRRC